MVNNHEERCDGGGVAVPANLLKPPMAVEGFYILLTITALVVCSRCGIGRTLVLCIY